MKVILTQDVEKLGHAMDVVVVKDGYARNYLMPRQMAMTATKSALANLEHLKKIEEGKQAKLRAGALEQAAKLEGQTLAFEDANVGEGGRLYGSYGTANIAKAIAEQFGVEVERRQIALDSDIRSEGFYSVPVKLYRDVIVDLKVKVGNPSEEVAPAATEAAPATEEVAA